MLGGISSINQTAIADFNWLKSKAPAGFDWGNVRNFSVVGVNGKIRKSYLLADPARKPLETELSSTGDKLTVRLPDKATDEIDSVLCVEVD